MRLKAKTIQLVVACLLVLVGVVLLFIGIFCPPLGVIDSSVLVAFGEALTFAGSIFGVDYSYRYKMTKLNFDTKNQMQEEE